MKATAFFLILFVFSQFRAYGSDSQKLNCVNPYYDGFSVVYNDLTAIKVDIRPNGYSREFPSISKASSMAEFLELNDAKNINLMTVEFANIDQESNISDRFHLYEQNALLSFYKKDGSRIDVNVDDIDIKLVTVKEGDPAKHFKLLTINLTNDRKSFEVKVQVKSHFEGGVNTWLLCNKMIEENKGSNTLEKVVSMMPKEDKSCVRRVGACNLGESQSCSYSGRHHGVTICTCCKEKDL